MKKSRKKEKEKRQITNQLLKWSRQQNKKKIKKIIRAINQDLQICLKKLNY